MSRRPKELKEEHYRCCLCWGEIPYWAGCSDAVDEALAANVAIEDSGICDVCWDKMGGEKLVVLINGSMEVRL